MQDLGDVFAAALAYDKTYRPTIRVLENFLNAPWNELLAEYEGIHHVSVGVLVDSKYYYLPQTPQRGYMVCIDKFKLDACSVDSAVFQTGLLWSNVGLQMSSQLSLGHVHLGSTRSTGHQGQSAYEPPLLSSLVPR